MLEPKLLYRRMETLLERVAKRTPPRRLAERLLPALFDDLRTLLPLEAVELYRHRDGRFARVKQNGVEVPDLAAELTERFDGGDEQAGELPWAGDTNAGPVGLVGVPDGLGSVIALRFGDLAGGGAQLLPVVS